MWRICVTTSLLTIHPAGIPKTRRQRRFVLVGSVATMTKPRAPKVEAAPQTEKVSAAPPPKKETLPKLPQLLERKFSKTGQTRGASANEIYQNRVNRNSTVLIPYNNFSIAKNPPEGDEAFENGFIVLIRAEDYFNTPDIEAKLLEKGLKIGENCLIFYQTRLEWKNYKVEQHNLAIATQRTAPLGGHYVARVAGTTASNDDESKVVSDGFNVRKSKGAGIRVFEYARKSTIDRCRKQLEGIHWMCRDAISIAVQNGMTSENATKRKELIISDCHSDELWDVDRLKKLRILNKEGFAICPLCMKELSARGFYSREEQAEGRGVHNLTTTQISLFHIGELKVGRYEHREYNLGWGHHHCNTVVKDVGIDNTLKWIKEIVDKNTEEGYNFDLVSEEQKVDQQEQ